MTIARRAWVWPLIVAAVGGFVYFNSLSNEMSIFLAQWAHSVAMATDTALLTRFPCTKGAAMASSAHAAYNLSPLLKVK